MAQEAKQAGALILGSTPFVGAWRSGSEIRLADIGLSTRFLIGADGARSRVARAFGLSENRRFLTGLEVELDGDTLDPRFLHCFVDSRLAPGYIAWAAPGPDAIQLGLAVRHGDRPDLAAFIERTEPQFGWSRMKVKARRSGLIPCGGLLKKTAASGVLLIGDAAGWVSPMTGGGIRLALRYGRRAAALVADHLTGRGPSPETALSCELPRFGVKRLARLALDRAPPNAIVNWALSMPTARRLAEKVYFHRRGADVDRESYLTLLDAELPRRTLPMQSVGRREQPLA